MMRRPNMTGKVGETITALEWVRDLVEEVRSCGGQILHIDAETFLEAAEELGQEETDQLLINGIKVQPVVRDL